MLTAPFRAWATSEITDNKTYIKYRTLSRDAIRRYHHEGKIVEGYTGNSHRHDNDNHPLARKRAQE